MGQTSGSVVMHRFESRVLDPISGFGGLEYLGYLGSDVHIHIHKDIYIYIGFNWLRNANYEHLSRVHLGLGVRVSVCRICTWNVDDYKTTTKVQLWMSVGV